MRWGHFGLAVCLLLAAGGRGLAADLKAVERFSGTEITFDISGAYSNVTLTIASPSGAVEEAYSRRGAPSLDLRRRGEMEDGLYTYELTAASDETVKVVPRLDNGRGDRERPEERVGVTMTGTFRVMNGAIMPVDRRPEREVKGGAERGDQDR